VVARHLALSCVRARGPRLERPRGHRGRAPASCGGRRDDGRRRHGV